MPLSPEIERQIADWMDAHNVRETCVWCDRAAPVINGIYASAGRALLHRTCTACAHVAMFDATRMGLVTQASAESVPNAEQLATAVTPYIMGTLLTSVRAAKANSGN